MAEHRKQTGGGAPGDPDVTPDERMQQHREVNERQNTGVGRFQAGVAKSGLWIVLAVVVLIILLALIF